MVEDLENVKVGTLELVVVGPPQDSHPYTVENKFSGSIGASFLDPTCRSASSEEDGSDLPLDTDLCKNDAATKMTQKAVRALTGQARSQAENLILSGWQGSDEDEDVSIDSSDDEKDSPHQKGKSSSTASVLRPRPAEEHSGTLEARDTESFRIKRLRPVSSPQLGRSGPDPGGGSAMKVKSSDARRFRKELTAKKSGAKLAVVPGESSYAPSRRGSPGSKRKDREKDARVEDVEDEEVSHGNSPDNGNKGRSVRESQPRSVGTGDKVDQGQLESVVAETRKRKGRDSKGTSECDDEARKKRRYRELEQAQRIADRLLTLRERPESRQRNGSRREASTRSNFVGRRLRMVGGGSMPHDTDSPGRLRSGNEVLTLAMLSDERWKTSKLQKHFNRKAKLSNRDAEIAEKVVDKRFTRSTEKLPGGTSPSKQAAGVSTKTTYMLLTDSKDMDLAMEKDRSFEGTPEEPKKSIERKNEGLSLSVAETVDIALDNVFKNVSTGMNHPKSADPPTSDGNSADEVIEVKKATPRGKGTDLFCKESFDSSVEKALNDSKEEKEANDNDNVKVTEKSAEDYVAVNSDAGAKPEKEESEKRRRDCTDLGVSVIDTTKSRSEAQVSGESVEDRESRCLRPLGEGAVDLSAEGAATQRAVGAKPGMNATQEAGDPQISSKADSEGPELEERLDKFSDENGREGSAACSLERVSHISLSNEDSSGRPMTGGLVLHDQSSDTIAVCDLTVEDADDDHSEEASEVDDHNSFCEACLLGGMLLCCDASGCKVTYHLECADPPMMEVPEGKWYCPSCAQKRLSFGVHASLKSVDSIWDVRDCSCPLCSGCRHDSGKGDAGGSCAIVHELEDRTRVLDVPVKPLESSLGMMENSPRSSTGLSQRVTRRKQMELEGQKQSENQKTDATTSTSKSTLIVHSAKGPGKGCDKQYFVKWKNLSHIHNAWVSEGDLKKAAPKMLESFRKRLETETLNQKFVEPSTFPGKRQEALNRDNVQSRPSTKGIEGCTANDRIRHNENHVISP